VQKHTFEEKKLQYFISKNRLKILLLKQNVLILSTEASKQDLAISKANLKKIDALQKEILSMQSVLLAIDSQKNEISYIINDLNITSPIDGYIDSKIANKGEVLAPGMSIATLIDPKSFFLKVYINTINNGKIKIGDRAEIFLDAFPNKPIMAKVSSISKQAEFTPKEVAVRSDRITRVYEIHLKPVRLNPFLKLGIPAIGIISLHKNKKLPKSLNELPEL
jgi:HlyD family secretion protein